MYLPDWAEKNGRIAGSGACSQESLVLYMLKSFLIFVLLIIAGVLFSNYSVAQMKWQNVDSLYQPLPASVHVYKTTELLDGKTNIAYYVEAGLKDKKLDFTVDTTYKRRLTPSKFYVKNDNPLLVVNTTFFSFETNSSLNLVVRDGKILSKNLESVPLRGKDTLKYFHTLSSAIGITEDGADIAWLLTRNSKRKIIASPWPIYWTDSTKTMEMDSVDYYSKIIVGHSGGKESVLSRWKVRTAVGGGPVLMTEGKINITNNEELKFAGKAIEDKHPRTAMGYTKDNKLIILVIEGRNPGKAEGATLTEEAQIFKDLGCWEAINMDGGGSSCMLVNGKETIKVSDATGQRPIPAVFIIKAK